jgi:hypothetical protein
MSKKSKWKRTPEEFYKWRLRKQFKENFILGGAEYLERLKSRLEIVRLYLAGENPLPTELIRGGIKAEPWFEEAQKFLSDCENIDNQAFLSALGMGK